MNKRVMFISVGMLMATLGVMVAGCPNNGNPINPIPPSPVATSTTTFSSTFTTTPTITLTITNTPTNTLSPTPTTTCTVVYSDDFSSSGTFSNYEFLSKYSLSPAALTITGGEMVMSPGSGLSGLMVLVKNSVLSHALSNYTLNFDAKMDVSNTYGDFGAAFRGNISSPNMSYYSFLWNRNPEHSTPHWQAVNFYGAGGNSYIYLGGSNFGTGASTPVYTIGGWTHITVICSGTNIQCFADTGSGSVSVFNFTDATYANGGVGFHADFIQPPNLVRFDNLVVCSP